MPSGISQNSEGDAVSGETGIKSNEDYFLSAFAFFFFFFIAMVVFLWVSVKPPAGGSLSVADAVLGLSPLPGLKMA